MKLSFLPYMFFCVCIPQTTHGTNQSEAPIVYYQGSQSRTTNPQAVTLPASIATCTTPEIEMLGYGAITVLGIGNMQISLLNGSTVGVITSGFAYFFGIAGIINYLFDVCSICRTEQTAQAYYDRGNEHEEV